MSYHHLTRNERGKIAWLKNKSFSVRAIARELGRSPSTISRELARGTIDKPFKHSVRRRYLCEPAQQAADLRRRNSHRRYRYEDPWLSEYVQEKLSLCWSPEQIAGRLHREYPQQKEKWVSHSSIYRWLKEGVLTQSAALRFNLRHAGHRHGDTRGDYHGIRELKERSRLALRRKRLGDWEVDTIASSVRTESSGLLSVCDRKSRYCGLVLLRRRTAEQTLEGFRFLFGPGKLPLETMAADRGKEFACYKEVEKEFCIPFYFARPHSPWQKPTVENLNGLVRQFFPKGTNFSRLSQKDVDRVVQLLNSRPRKSLDFATPEEVLHFT